MKVRVVQRVMRGESLELLAREFGTSVAKVSQWRDEFIQAGEEAMKKDRGSDEKDLPSSDTRYIRGFTLAFWFECRQCTENLDGYGFEVATKG